MNSRTWIADNLAAAFLSGAWTPEAMAEAGRAALSTTSVPRWLERLVHEMLAWNAAPYPPAPEALARAIARSEAIHGLGLEGRKRPLIRRAVLAPPAFAPAPNFGDLEIPALATAGALAEWLGLSVARLEWLADVEGFRARGASETGRHYGYAWAPKKSGPPRLVEAPKPLLKEVQRKILREILDRVPPHEAAHGFRRGRSCLTAARRHAGEAVVVALDLRDFFASIPARRVHGLFRRLGYPWAVARLLTGLCTTATPSEVFDGLPQSQRHDWQTRQRFLQPHLPQGAPTSPALANLCAWRLDRRLDGLAASLEARYTRYGDDLAFSGDRDFARRLDGFLPLAEAICHDEGLALNRSKTRIMGQGGRQRLTGLVVNRHVNVPRADYDRLKAILHNCLRHGPAGQNRDGHADFRAHLDGRITWVETANPGKGHRLRLLFQQVAWV